MVSKFPCFLAAASLSLFASGAPAQVAGRAAPGVTPPQTQAVLARRSARKGLLGKDVVNERNEKVGKIDDLIVSPDQAISYAIVGTGGFVGMGRHDVAIPLGQLQSRGENYLLPGASKEALKALPAFEYTGRER